MSLARVPAIKEFVAGTRYKRTSTRNNRVLSKEVGGGEEGAWKEGFSPRYFAHPFLP